MGAKDIDLIVLATTTPDETFPATATVVQSRLGMTHGAAFDVQAVCSGFVYAVAVADNFIKAGQSRGALVIRLANGTEVPVSPRYAALVRSLIASVPAAADS